MRLSRGGAFFRDLLFGTSWGYPLGPILASAGTLLVRCCRLFGRFGKQICSQIRRLQNNNWHQPHLQKNKRRLKTTLLISPPNKSCSFDFCCLTKPHKFEALGLNNNTIGGTPEGITIQSFNSIALLFGH